MWNIQFDFKKLQIDVGAGYLFSMKHIIQNEAHYSERSTLFRTKHTTR